MVFENFLHPKDIVRPRDEIICKLNFSKIFVGFRSGQNVVFAGYPHVEGGKQEDADDQVGQQAADNDDGEGTL
jgi:hypothetical protein